MADDTAHFEVNPRDRGLVRGIGVTALTANVVNYTIGASIFVMPALVAKDAGAWAPLAFIIAAIATFAITLCFAEAGARVPTSGGQAGFTEVAFGKFAGFQVGVLTYLANVLAAGAITAAAADTVASVWPQLSSPPARTAMIVAWGGLLALVNLGSIRRTARVVEAAAVLKLIPLLLFLAVGAVFVVPANFTMPSLPPPPGLGHATLLVFFLFAGVHGSLLAGGEIRNPARTLPVSLILGMAIVTAIFIGAALVSQGLLGRELASSAAPLADGLSKVSPALGTVMVAGALIAMLGWTASDALATPRSLFALARDKSLPGWLAGLHPRNQTPHRAVFVHVAIVATLASNGSFAGLAIICSLVLVLLSVGACVTALVLRYRKVEMGGAAPRLTGLPFAALVGSGAAIWVGLQATVMQVLAVAAVIAVSSIWYAIVSRRHRSGTITAGLQKT